ncbi:uncharacterized protein LOC111119081 [Crassostrea virginica]
MIFLNPPRERNARRKKKRPPPPENDEGLCMGILQTSLNMGFIVLVFVIGSTKGEWLIDIVKYVQSTDNATTIGFSIDEFLPSMQWPEFRRVESLPKSLLYSALLSVIFYNVLVGIWFWIFNCGKQRKGFGDIEEDSTMFYDAVFSSFNVALLSAVSALIAWFTYSKGYSRLYSDVSDRGWLYFAVSVPALFLYHEIITYYRHRTLHSPALYKNVHFWRHWPKQTTWSLMVMHPVESVLILLQSLLPIFIIPTHIAVYFLLTMYTVHNDLVFHSSEKPFQQNHKKYKDVNFGASSVLLDWACGTLLFDAYNTYYSEPNYHNKEE